jgi:hypothetical protein
MSVIRIMRTMRIMLIIRVMRIIDGYPSTRFVKVGRLDRNQDVGSNGPPLHKRA